MTERDSDEEAWLLRLDAAYKAGFYRTEAAEDEQLPFPWQHRTCGDCPFWVQDHCLVHDASRPPDAHTCRYFDRPNRAEARAIIRQRRWEVMRRLGSNG